MNEHTFPIRESNQTADSGEILNDKQRDKQVIYNGLSTFYNQNLSVFLNRK